MNIRFNKERYANDRTINIQFDHFILGKKTGRHLLTQNWKLSVEIDKCPILYL